jgi:hypothetical protein
MEWMVELSGDPSDLDELSKVFTSPELCIQKDGENFLLKSDDFRSCVSSDDVKKIASEILNNITAGIKLSLDARKKIDIAGIIQIRDDGGRICSIEVSSEVIIGPVLTTIGVIHADGTREEFNPADPIPRWIKIAHKDAKVAKAFKFIVADFNSWYSLYKILEVLEEDNFKPIMRKGRYRNKVRIFKHTADCYETTGIDARHAHLNEKAPPKNPMSLSEAKSFIKMLLHEWLREKESKL